MTVIANFKAFVQRLSGQDQKQSLKDIDFDSDDFLLPSYAHVDVNIPPRPFFSNDFTKAELQKLQFILRENTKAFSEVLTELKVRSALAWSLSNKEDPSTEPAFAEFSQLQKDKQRVQHHLRGLERLQNKVKRQLRA